MILPSIIIYWIVGLGLAALAGYAAYAYSQMYYRRGKRKAYKLVVGGLVQISEDIFTDLERLRDFRNRIFDVALEADRVDIRNRLEPLVARISDIEQKIDDLRHRRDKLTSQSTDPNTEISDAYYIEAGKRLLEEITQIEQDLQSAVGSLTDIRDRSIQATLGDVAPKMLTTVLWYDRTKHYLALWSSAVSKDLFILFLVVADLLLGYFSLFKGIFTDLIGPSANILSVVLSLAITLMCIAMAHTILSNLRSKNYRNITDVVTGILLPALCVLFIVGLVLWARIQTSVLQPALEILIWMFFIGLIFWVGYSSTNPQDPIDIKRLFKAPVLFVINMLALPVVGAAWIVENIGHLLTNIFKSTPISDQERTLKQRIVELEGMKSKQIKELDELRKQHDAFRRSEITKTQTEAIERVKSEIKTLEQRIEQYVKELEDARKQSQEQEHSLSDLRRGSDDGTDNGIIVVKKAREEEKRKEKQREEKQRKEESLKEEQRKEAKHQGEKHKE